MPAISEDDPMDIANEGAEAQPGHWPETTRHTPESEMIASDGNGHPMRQHFLDHGFATYVEGTPQVFQDMLAQAGETEAAG